MISDLQQNITNIYSIITDNRKLNELKNLMFHNTIEPNATTERLLHELKIEEKKLRIKIQELSGSVEDLFSTIKICKNFIEREKNKNPEFKKVYDRYYKYSVKKKIVRLKNYE